MAGFRHHGDASVDIAMIPHPAVTVLVDLTGHGMVYDVGAGARSGSVVVGLSPGPVRVAAPGPWEVLQIRLSPIAAVAMLGDPQVVGGAVTPLADLWGHHSEIFAEQIRALPSWEERFAFTSRALPDRAAPGLRAAPEIACQRSLGNPVGWSCFARAGGHQFSRLVAACSPGRRG
jgi:hypothetical protein